METYCDSMAPKKGSARKLAADLVALARDTGLMLRGRLEESRKRKSASGVESKDFHGGTSSSAGQPGPRCGLEKVIEEKPLFAASLAFATGLILGVWVRRR